MLPTTDRAAVGHLLGCPSYIDLAIPRGGESLIRRVVAEARMPVLKHYQGNCHVYVDRRVPISRWPIQIILNAKVQRPGRLQRGRDAAGASRDRRGRSCPGPPRPCSARASSCAATTPAGRSFPP